MSAERKTATRIVAFILTMVVLLIVGIIALLFKFAGALWPWVVGGIFVYFVILGVIEDKKDKGT